MKHEVKVNIHEINGNIGLLSRTNRNYEKEKKKKNQMRITTEKKNV